MYLRERAKITSSNLFIKTLKTLGILQTECELILTRSLIPSCREIDAVVLMLIIMILE